MLANDRQVSPSTHRQALNALLFLYKEVLGLDLPWLQSIGRPPERKRVPVVSTKDEVIRRFFADGRRGRPVGPASGRHGHAAQTTRLRLRVKDMLTLTGT